MVQVTYHTIGPGSSGIRDTLHLMRRIVRASVAQPIVRLSAVQIVQGTGFNVAQQLTLLRQFIQQHTEFLRDPRGVELLHTPAYLLTQISEVGTVAGDCDDIAMLVAALGMAVGLRARFVVIGQRELEHVFTMLASPHSGTWEAFDPTRPGPTIPASMLQKTLVVEV